MDRALARVAAFPNEAVAAAKSGILIAAMRIGFYFVAKVRESG